MIKKSKSIVFTVINDLTYDRRMERICSSLALNGYSVTLVGRVFKDSKALENKTYHQKRLCCWFNRGLFFYAEYNFRLFFYLLRNTYEVYGAVDLDTILPNKLVSLIKKKILVYDAHEYFTEVIEIQQKPLVKRFWKWVEKVSLNENLRGYTVSNSYAELFNKAYHTTFELIRNCPPLEDIKEDEKYTSFTFIYVGAVNKGRGIEECIEAVKGLNAKLRICGDGDVLEELKANLSENQKDQVSFTGFLQPKDLEKEIRKSHVGLLLLKAESLSYYYSLANKFFDYVHAGVPQIVIDFPEYISLNNEIEVAKISSIDTVSIREKMEDLITDRKEYSRLKNNTVVGKRQWNWAKEEEKLFRFYSSLF